VSELWQEDLDEKGEKTMTLFLSIISVIVGFVLMIILISNISNDWPIWTLIAVGILSCFLIISGGWFGTLPAPH
jgi:hypothetical protein